MTESEIRSAELREAANFLDAGQGVDQGYLRNALASALHHIANLNERIAELEKRVFPKNAIDELS